MLGTLSIYDGGDSIAISVGRGVAASDYVAVTGGADGLIASLDKLLANGKQFSNAVFTTHGVDGAINFKGDITFINARWIQNPKSGLAGKGYHRLFPHFPSIYFQGCNVAEGDNGWKFLEAVGSVLCLNGGSVSGRNTAGLGVRRNVGWAGFALAAAFLPISSILTAASAWSGKKILDGEIIHPPWSDKKTVFFIHGGKVMLRWTE
ncbi:hypothetical protein [Mesorhizobium sp. IMUNJ 23232]|uniref:hypothetical protein n=1 Tax=Mesorhizobium sp. IMUNJ 23232 TaxID=3376064 RepID=UPI0037BD8981